MAKAYTDTRVENPAWVAKRDAEKKDAEYVALRNKQNADLVARISSYPIDSWSVSGPYNWDEKEYPGYSLGTVIFTAKNDHGTLEVKAEHWSKIAWDYVPCGLTFTVTLENGKEICPRYPNVEKLSDVPIWKPLAAVYNKYKTEMSNNPPPAPICSSLTLDTLLKVFELPLPQLAQVLSTVAVDARGRRAITNLEKAVAQAPKL